MSCYIQAQSSHKRGCPKDWGFESQMTLGVDRGFKKIRKVGYNMNLFDLKGKNAVILGGGGILGHDMAQGLAHAGANIAVGDLREEMAVSLAESLANAHGIKAKGYQMNAMEIESIKSVCAAIKKDFGSIDILVNAVGGNMPGATTSDTVTFFDLQKDAIQKCIDLNLMAGAILPCQVFGREMAESENGGAIINISSMNYYRPLTRTPGYAAAKAAVSNFTQWLAVDLAQAYGEKVSGRTNFLIYLQIVINRKK